MTIECFFCSTTNTVCQSCNNKKILQLVSNKQAQICNLQSEVVYLHSEIDKLKQQLKGIILALDITSSQVDSVEDFLESKFPSEKEDEKCSACSKKEVMGHYDEDYY